jgi:hypothetical protein
MKNNKEKLDELIFTAIGEASMCWANPSGAGVYQDQRATEIGNKLIQGIGELFWPKMYEVLQDLPGLSKGRIL